MSVTRNQKISILILCIPLSFLIGFWLLYLELESIEPFSEGRDFEFEKEELYHNYRYPFAFLCYGLFVGISLTLCEYYESERIAFWMFAGYLSLVIGHLFSWFVIPIFLSLCIFLISIGITILEDDSLLYLPIFGILINLYFIPLQFMYIYDFWSVFGD